MSVKLVVFVALLTGALSTGSHESQLALANPIRKVVTMLQSMQAKVQEEGEKELALYDKYMCYCKTAGGDLQGSIASAEDSISELGGKIKAAEEQMVVLKEELKTAKADRAAAKAAMAEATAIREKEAAAYAAEKAAADKDIAAVAKAVAALEKGMAGAFLQTDVAQTLKNVVSSRKELMEDDREDLMAFLSNAQGTEYAPQSGQITGILKTMGDEMAAGLAEATKAEEAGIAVYEKLMVAKKKEVVALTKEIETKLTRIGDLGVEIAEMKNDLGDTQEALIADKKFLENLEENCEKKKKEWDVIVKTRAEELAALADTIKVLNDDDALELFKKTLPSAASFLQVQVAAAEVRARALAGLKEFMQQHPNKSAKMELLALALEGKKIGFEKVIKMIDDMVATLKVEQKDDDTKKEYCAEELDLSDDKKKKSGACCGRPGDCN
jgi:predicted  nucleic acid-binding Zn-ribbon protein